MRNQLLYLTIALSALACKKDVDPQPDPVVDNGPIGGTYNLTAVTTKTYDTTQGTGIITMNEYTVAATDLKGSIAITAANMSSKGQMYNYTRTGTRKETNTATNATVTSNQGATSGSSGSASGSFNSAYTINATAKTVTVNDGQYLFNPAFITQPASKTHSYVVSGNTLKITTDTYEASSRTRTVNESTFTKQ